MYRILKLNESAKLEEKDAVQDYIDFCNDMNIEPKDKSSINKYMNVFSRMYAQYNGISNLEKAQEEQRAKLNRYLAEADDLEDEAEEDEEKIEDIENNQEETLDSEEEQNENPAEEESTLDTQLDELRDILVDLDDIRLYKVVSKDNEEFYILGKVASDSNDVEMLVDTQPINYENKDDSEETQEEINPEEINQKYQFVSLPLQFDMIKDMNPKYGEDLNPNHEELVSYLMNLLVEQNPEAAEEQREEVIEEPKDEELPEEINSEEEEDEDEEI